MSQQQQQQYPNIQYQRKVSRTRCRYDAASGRQYCESDEQAQSASSHGDSHYERQQCQYINGESYCESHTTTEQRQQNQQQDQQKQIGIGGGSSGWINFSKS